MRRNRIIQKKFFFSFQHETSKPYAVDTDQKLLTEILYILDFFN